MIFLDSAGSSLPAPGVVDAMVAHLRREAEVGGYRAADERAADLVGLKDALGRLIGAAPADIALTDGATRGWAAFLDAVPLRPGDRILLTHAEYASSALTALSRARATGATIDLVPAAADGTIDIAALQDMLDERVRLVSVVQVPSHTGTIQPVRPIADLAHAAGALVLLDACQAVGQLPVSVADLGVDALTATGRKWLRAPRGTGFLYVRPGLELDEPAALDRSGARWTEPFGYALRPGAARFELGEAGYAARLGLKVAVDHLLAAGIEAVSAAIQANAARLRAGLAATPGVTVLDRGTQLSGLSGIVTFSVDDVDPAVVRDRLAVLGIIVTVSVAEVSLWDMSARGLTSLVRASPHADVPAEQLDAAVAAVAAIAAGAGAAG